jgi:hypothetical protein
MLSSSLPRRLSLQVNQNYYSTASPSSETTPLVPRHKHKTKSPLFPVILLSIIVLIVIPLSAICGAYIYQSMSTNILDPAVRDRIQHEWTIEQRRHDEDTERIRHQWSLELKKHDERMNRIRYQWSIELKRHNEDMKRHQAAMERAKSEERRWQEKERGWQEKEQRREREEEQRWQEKKQRREREEAERMEREKWERQRMRLYG